MARHEPPRETELWLKIHKKTSGRTTVTYAQALDVALCWGWIDGIRKSFDEVSFLQRFTPRKAKSVWIHVRAQRLLQAVEALPKRGGPETDIAVALEVD